MQSLKDWVATNMPSDGSSERLHSAMILVEEAGDMLPGIQERDQAETFIWELQRELLKLLAREMGLDLKES